MVGEQGRGEGGHSVATLRGSSPAESRGLIASSCVQSGGPHPCPTALTKSLTAGLWSCKRSAHQLQGWRRLWGLHCSHNSLISTPPTLYLSFLSSEAKFCSKTLTLYVAYVQINGDTYNALLALTPQGMRPAVWESSDILLPFACALRMAWGPLGREWASGDSSGDSRPWRR